MKILTFDIEDWFHILDNPETRAADSWSQFPSRLQAGVERILDMLSASEQRATFFCLGWVAEKYPNVVREIDRAGFHIGSHSHSHQLAYEQTKDEYREDLRRSIATLQDTIGKKVDCYRAPGFSITAENLWAFDVLYDEGIRVDASVFPAGRAHGGLPGFSVASPTIGVVDAGELRLFPINTRRFLGRNLIYAGGGYFRLLPQALVNRWFEDDEYVMTYFHPRDFDPDQPLAPGLSAVRRFKSYVGLKGAQRKLEHLLNTHRFDDVPTALQRVDWRSTPRVRLTTQ